MKARLTLVAVCALVVAAQELPLIAHMQSLADVASKAAQRRGAPTEPTRLLTNADLKACEDSAPSSSSAAASTASTTAAFVTAPSREDIVRAVISAVVTIETSEGTGSGFFVAPGLVLTNRHVIGGASSMRVKFANGRISSAYVSASAVSNVDLALLRVDNSPPSQPLVTLGRTTGVQVGEEVLAIGSALGVLQSTVTRGIVSAVRSVGGVTYLQTDAAINPGNSGGPLVDKNGQAIGITTSKLAPGESLGFAIGVEHARTLIQGQSSPAIVRRGCSAVSDASGQSGSDGQLEAVLNTSEQSTTNLARERGAKEFDAAVQALARQADNVDILWQRYRAACAGKSSGGVVNGRDWFGIWTDPVVSKGESLPQCRALLSDIVDLGARIHSGMQQSEENARRASVYPGTTRDIRQKYAMEWSGWDR